MTEKEMWEKYLSEHPWAEGKKYEAWRYGSDTPDKLAGLTASGIKTATASAYPLYEYENCDLPKVGDYNIFADGWYRPVHNPNNMRYCSSVYASYRRACLQRG